MSRFIVILILLMCLDIYAFQAILLLAQNWSKNSKIILFATYWSIPLIAISTVIAANFSDISTWNRTFFTFLRAFLIIAYFSKLLIVSALLLDDVRRLLLGAWGSVAGNVPFDKSRSQFLSKMGLLLGAFPLVTLTYGMIRNRYRFTLHRQIAHIEDLPDSLDGLKIVQISDIHSGSFNEEEPLHHAIDMINEQSPDLVFFTGDLVNNVAGEMTPYMDVFNKIKSRHGVYSVLGNHDYGDYVSWESREAKIQNLDQLKSVHRELGWDLLLNEHRALEINGEKVAVIGVENYSALPQFPKYGDLALARKGSEDAALKLLLSHDPTHWESQVTKDHPDIAVTFSGHTHGFQFGIEIPGWIRWSPSQYVYKQWAGMYRKGKQILYVNRGLGMLGYPGRVGILPEVTLLVLKKK